MGNIASETFSASFSQEASGSAHSAGVAFVLLYISCILNWLATFDYIWCSDGSESLVTVS